MTQETINEETKLTYDDRRKILHQKKSQVTENKKDAVTDKEGKITEKEKLLSTVNQSLDVDYTEEGIRLAHKDLTETKKSFETQLIELEKKFNEVGEMPKDLKEFKEKMLALAKYDRAEKARANHEAIKEELAKVSKELNGLTDEIGTRLKF